MPNLGTLVPFYEGELDFMRVAAQPAVNRTTRLITVVLGITIALSGIHHGLFEIFQGNTPTDSLIIQSIGLDDQRWENGEEAFTVIPNFLATGITAIVISMIIMVWSALFIDKKHGRTGFILLFVILTLTGGGIGHIIFFLPVWIYATRIDKPLRWWRRKIPQSVRLEAARAWKVLLAVTVAFLTIGLEISVFGIPGFSNDELIMVICWGFLVPRRWFC